MESVTLQVKQEVDKVLQQKEEEIIRLKETFEHQKTQLAEATEETSW